MMGYPLKCTMLNMYNTFMYMQVMEILQNNNNNNKKKSKINKKKYRITVISSIFISS